jgi:hypothetical protein
MSQAFANLWAAFAEQQQNNIFHIDATVAAACAAADVAILVGVLVFSSVLQLVRGQRGSSFSIKVAEVLTQSGRIVVLVESLVYLSTVSGCLSLVGMTIKTDILGTIALALSLLTIIFFSLVCILSIRWFWKHEEPGD